MIIVTTPRCCHFLNLINHHLYLLSIIYLLYQAHIANNTWNGKGQATPRDWSEMSTEQQWNSLRADTLRAAGGSKMYCICRLKWAAVSLWNGAACLIGCINWLTLTSPHSSACHFKSLFKICARGILVPFQITCRLRSYTWVRWTGAK